MNEETLMIALRIAANESIEDLEILNGEIAKDRDKWIDDTVARWLREARNE